MTDVVSIMFTQDQVDIAILKDRHEGIMSSMTDIKNSIAKIEMKLESNYTWTMGLILGIYAIGMTSIITALGHAYGWF